MIFRYTPNDFPHGAVCCRRYFYPHAAVALQLPRPGTLPLRDGHLGTARTLSWQYGRRLGGRRHKQPKLLPRMARTPLKTQEKNHVWWKQSPGQKVRAPWQGCAVPPAHSSVYLPRLGTGNCPGERLLERRWGKTHLGWKVRVQMTVTRLLHSATLPPFRDCLCQTEFLTSWILVEHPVRCIRRRACTTAYTVHWQS